MIKGHSEPYCFNRNRNGVGFLIYVREDTPKKPLLTNQKLPHDIEEIFVELNLRKNKWLLFGSYHPLSQSDEYLLNRVKDGLDSYRKVYDKYMLIGDFTQRSQKRVFCNFFLK